MDLIGGKILSYFKDDLFERNRKAAYKRNSTVVRIVLTGSMVCYILLFIASLFSIGFIAMRWLYLTVVSVFAAMLACSMLMKESASSWLFYSAFFVFIGLCTYSSSAIFPDSISVMVLLALFIFPALSLDKGYRVNAVSILTALAYLAIIARYKEPDYFSEELINVTCFTLLGCVVGSYMRKVQLQNFDTMEQLRISREQYRLAVEHGKGIILEFDVPSRCILLKPEAASVYNAAERVADIPYGPVREGLVAKESAEEYIRFYEAIIAGEETGASEFLCKTAKGWRYQRAVFTTIFSDTGAPLSAVISVTDETERRAEEEAQRAKAEKDGLTGIYNRATTETLVNKALHEKSEGALLIIDLDELKRINDTFGHPSGDEALRIVARTLAARLRQTDVVGRVGGDEFAAFMKGANTQETIARIMDELMEQLGKCRIGEHFERQLSVSIGVALADGNDTSFDALYKKADIALYAAKENGKRQYSFFS